ncbi:hypothetical protein BQ1740_3151 [Bacillus subtilis]|nr:hypothetical protein BQ1740_3151 [Bacillus subtilis]
MLPDKIVHKLVLINTSALILTSRLSDLKNHQTDGEAV